MTENIIKVENLIFEYAKTGEEENITVRAIDDVSFEIEKGSFTAIIGKNDTCEEPERAFNSIIGRGVRCRI